MAVQTFSKKSSGSNYISKNFQVYEFACKDGADKVLIDVDFVKNKLQQIRDHFGTEIEINSGYRTESHNKAVGGATGSYHVKGRAFDIDVSGATPIEVARYAQSIGILGIGLYKGFVHVDSRDYKSFWDSTSGTEKSVSGFGGSSASTGTSSGWYRIRTSWGQPDSQIGAYQDLSNAKSACPAGYKVYDESGNEVYSNGSKRVVKVRISNLRIRTGPGTGYATVRNCPVGTYTITETKDATGHTWGKLLSGEGWIALDYTE